MRKTIYLLHASYIHPRSENFIPLFVCYGINQTKGDIVFNDYFIGKRSIAAVWDSI